MSPLLAGGSITSMLLELRRTIATHYQSIVSPCVGGRNDTILPVPTAWHLRGSVAFHPGLWVDSSYLYMYFVFMLACRPLHGSHRGSAPTGFGKLISCFCFQHIPRLRILAHSARERRLVIITFPTRSFYGWPEPCSAY